MEELRVSNRWLASALLARLPKVQIGAAHYGMIMMFMMLHVRVEGS